MRTLFKTKTIKTPIIVPLILTMIFLTIFSSKASVILSNINDDDIQVVILNTDKTIEIKALQEQLKKKSIILQCDHIKRNKEGIIIKIHIKLKSSKGVVEGNYDHFSEIKIFSNNVNGIGISPVKLI